MVLYYGYIGKYTDGKLRVPGFMYRVWRDSSHLFCNVTKGKAIAIAHRRLAEAPENRVPVLVTIHAKRIGWRHGDVVSPKGPILPLRIEEVSEQQS